MDTEIVDAESLSEGDMVRQGERFDYVIAADQTGPIVRLRLALGGEGGAELKRTVERTAKYEVACA